MPEVKSKQLLVEGIDDLLAVVGIMEHHVAWPREKNRAPVFIDRAGSIDELLDTTYLHTKFKESGLEILGIMVDADDRPGGRWQSFRSLCRDIAPNLPDELPKNGMIVDCQMGLRLGFWLMPDCASEGMLETFLRYLVPTSTESLWVLAQRAVREAKQAGALYRDTHTAKANVHTWLAWQDPPGERLGMAATKKIFDPHAGAAAPFVSWFIELYGLAPTSSPTAETTQSAPNSH